MRAVEIAYEKFVVPELCGPEPALDVGARWFNFAAAMVYQFGCSAVHALDPDPGVSDPEIPGVIYHRLALMPPGMNGPIRFARLPDSLANMVMLPHMTDPSAGEFVTVEGLDLKTFMEKVGVDFWSVVKFNCEGAEYGILANWPGPIATQILFSLHEHTSANPNSYSPNIAIEEIERRLGQWYKPVRHNWEERHCAGFNYWDSLWVLK